MRKNYWLKKNNERCENTVGAVSKDAVSKFTTLVTLNEEIIVQKNDVEWAKKAIKDAYKSPEKNMDSKNLDNGWTRGCSIIEVISSIAMSPKEIQELYSEEIVISGNMTFKGDVTIIGNPVDIVPEENTAVNCIQENVGGNTAVNCTQENCRT